VPVRPSACLSVCLHLCLSVRPSRQLATADTRWASAEERARQAEGRVERMVAEVREAVRTRMEASNRAAAAEEDM
jgi:hypothetical protein